MRAIEYNASTCEMREYDFSDTGEPVKEKTKSKVEKLIEFSEGQGWI